MWNLPPARPSSGWTPATITAAAAVVFMVIAAIAASSTQNHSGSAVPSPARPTPATSAAAAPVATAPTTYIVQPGDGWWKIATDHGVTLQALLDANHATASTTIVPGETIALPDGATEAASSQTPTVAAAAPSQQVAPNVSEGTVGEKQACLKAIGYDVTVDGTIGPQTVAALTALQSRLQANQVTDGEYDRCMSGAAQYRASLAANGAQAPQGTASSPPAQVPTAAPGYGPRTEHVRGYAKKDGTYVAPYTRRAPH